MPGEHLGREHPLLGVFILLSVHIWWIALGENASEHI